MRYLVASAMLLTLASAIPIYPQSSVPPDLGRLYFLAATSTWNRTDSFPANLYQIGKGELRLIKQVVPSSEGVDFIRHYDGVLTIGSPHIRPTRLYLVDVRNGPSDVSGIPLVYPDNLGITTEVLLDSTLAGSLSVAFELTSDNATGPVIRRLNIVTLSSPLMGSDVIPNSPWPARTDLGVTGSTGGPLDQGDNVSCTIRDGQMVYVSPTGLIRLLPVPPRGIGPRDDCIIAGSNEKFLIYRRSFQSMEEVNAAKQKTFEIYNRSTHRTSEIEVRGSLSRVMLDGKWFIVTTVEPNQQHRPNPGVAATSEQNASALTPPIQELFASNEPPQYFPGICVIRDLESGAVFTLKTGQADTEILGVLGGTVIYRVNRRIIVGELENSTVLNSRVIAEGDDVPAIHWLLKGN